MSLMKSCTLEEEIPGGYIYVFQGNGANSLMKNNNLIFERGVIDLQYNNHFLIVTVDTTGVDKPQFLRKDKLTYYYQNFSKGDSTLQRIALSDLKKIVNVDSIIINHPLAK